MQSLHLWKKKFKKKQKKKKKNLKKRKETILLFPPKCLLFTDRPLHISKYCMKLIVYSN